MQKCPKNLSTMRWSTAVSLFVLGNVCKLHASRTTENSWLLARSVWNIRYRGNHCRRLDYHELSLDDGEVDSDAARSMEEGLKLFDDISNKERSSKIFSKKDRDDDRVHLTLSSDFENDDYFCGSRTFVAPSRLFPDSKLTQPLYSQDDNRKESPALPSLPKARLRSTGTTIVGCLVDGGQAVVLAADTRATDDRMVADKACEKVHCLASNTWCCGAGTSADLDALVRQVRYTLALQTLRDDSIGNRDENDTLESREPQAAAGVFSRPSKQVSAVCRMLRDALYDGGGDVGANLVLGGYDFSRKRALLTAIHPHGSMDAVPFAALGSGGLAAMGVLESRFRHDLSIEEGIALVQQAVKAGIDNDLGSGSQIDVVVVSRLGANYKRAAVAEEQILEGSRAEGSSDEFVDDASAEDASGRLGVNGFGNLPFTIKSSRVLRRSKERQEEIQRETWNEILGF